MRLFILAGEPSGDKLGTAVMAGLKELVPDIVFEGIGGPGMEAEGLRSLFPMADLSVMGLAEVLPRYPKLRRRLHQAAAAVKRFSPDALLTIDSPDFSLRLAKLSRQDIPALRTIHYVAPSVWAWRPGRAKKMARYVDHVLALLPFEPPYMEAAGMSCDFVGHPVVAEPVASADQGAAFRARHRLAADVPLILTLPGSRQSEVARLAPRFGDVLRNVAERIPNVCAVLPTVPHLTDQVKALTADWPVKAVLLDPKGDVSDEKRAAFTAADVALAASGTVSLELAAAGVPMVIGYDMAPISWAIMKRMARIDTVTLVNLVTQTRAVPEFLGPECQPEAMSAALLKLLTEPDAQTAQKAALEQTMLALGRGGDPPGLRAAQSVLAFLGTKS